MVAPKMFGEPESANYKNIGNSFLLSSPPSWVVSATVLPSEQIVLIDVLSNTIKFYNEDGILVNEVRSVFGTAIDHQSFRFLPTIVHTDGDAIVVESEEGKLLWMSSDGRVDRMLDLKAEFLAQGINLRSVYDWDLEGEHVFLFGDVLEDSGEWSAHFFHLNLSTNQVNKLLHFEIDSPTREMYLVGHRNIAIVGEYGGALVFDEGTTELVLYELAQLSERQTHEPDRSIRLRSASGLSSKAWDESPTPMQRFKALESTSYAAGLYGSGESFFVLSKGLEAECRWTLQQIEPSTSQSTTALLPLDGEHLVVAVGNHEWIFVQKGKVHALGMQEIGSAVRIPSDIVSSLLVSAAIAACE